MVRVAVEFMDGETVDYGTVLNLVREGSTGLFIVVIDDDRRVFIPISAVRAAWSVNVDESVVIEGDFAPVEEE